MKINELKELFKEFDTNVSFEYDLKKKTGLILVVGQKFFIKLRI